MTRILNKDIIAIDKDKRATAKKRCPPTIPHTKIDLKGH